MCLIDCHDISVDTGRGICITPFISSNLWWEGRNRTTSRKKAVVMTFFRMDENTNFFTLTKHRTVVILEMVLGTHQMVKLDKKTKFVITHSYSKIPNHIHHFIIMASIIRPAMTSNQPLINPGVIKHWTVTYPPHSSKVQPSSPITSIRQSIRCGRCEENVFCKTRLGVSSG